MKTIKKLIASFLAILMVMSTVVLIPVSADQSWEKMTREEYFYDNWRYKAVDSDSMAYIETSDIARGKSCLRLYQKTLRGGTDKYIWVAKPVTVQNGHIYKLEFDIKIQEAISDVSFRFDWSGTSLIPASKDYDWTTMGMTYHSEKDGVLELRWGTDNKLGGMWLDNIKFYDTENPSVNLVKNGDFEDLSGVIPSSYGSASASLDLGAEGTTDMYSMTGTEITVDGKSDEWENITAYPISTHTELMNGTWRQPGVEEISATVKFTHDEKNFYFIVEVYDKVHYNDFEASEYWKGDGIQFGLADTTLERPIYVERGLSMRHDDGRLITVMRNGGDTDFEYAVTREGDITTYEVAVPFAADFGDYLPADTPFSICVNNNDGGGRAYCKEITPGICSGKDYTKFNILRFWQPVGTLQQNTYVPSVVNANDKEMATVTLYNDTDQVKTASVTVDAINFKKTVSLEPGAVQPVSVAFSTGDVGIMELDIKVSCDGTESVIKKRIQVDIIYDAESYPVFRAKIVTMIDELKELMLKCEAKGFHMPYEQAYYSLLSRYLSLFDDEASHGDYDRMYLYEGIMTELYEKTKTNLNAYLKGEKKPMSVPQYVTSEIRNEGVSNYAMTENNGVMEERPVFFSGLCTFNETDKEMDFFRNVGINAVQFGPEYLDTCDLFVEGICGGFHVEYQKGCTGTVEATDEEAATGKGSMKIVSVNQPSGAYLQLNHQLWNLEEGVTYEYGLKAKGKSQKTDFIFGWDGTTRTNIPSTDDWVEYKTEFTMPVNKTSEVVRILVDGVTEGMYIDDVYVIKKGQDKVKDNLIIDGGFEKAVQGPTEFEQKVYDKLGLYVNPVGLERQRKRAQLAEVNNIYYDTSFSPQYLEYSYYLTNMYPELKAYVGRYLPFVVDDEKVRILVELLIEAYSQVYNEYDSVKSIMVHNEPQIYTNSAEYYKPHWLAFLTEKYGTVEALNEAYGSAYASLEEVAMPTKVTHDALFYDYRTFNDNMLTEWLSFQLEMTKKYMPDKDVHVKGMDYFRHDYAKDLINGFDFEKVAPYMDINGCDAMDHFRNSNTPMSLKMGWFDYMTSVSNKPIWDTESHPLTDGTSVVYIPEEARHVAASTWNGAIHGRAGLATWLWDVSEDNSLWKGGVGANWSNANMRFKPDIMIRFCETNLDMMRLSWEITAVQNAERKVGFTFSRTSLGYNDDHNKAATEVYEDCIYHGQKPLFITDTNFADMKNCEVLVISKSTTNISKEMLNEIKVYMEQGGKVILLDDISLKKDELDKEHDKAVVEYIYNNAICNTSVAEYIEKNQMSDVVLVDTETGKAPEKVEWLYNEYDGKMIVNVINYDENSDKTFKVLYKGNEVGELKELRSQETKQGPYTVTPYEPVLFEIAK